MTLDELIAAIREQYPTVSVNAGVFEAPEVPRKYRILITSGLKKSTQLFGDWATVLQQWETTKATWHPERDQRVGHS
jgi:hypothetical protein